MSTLLQFNGHISQLHGIEKMYVDVVVTNIVPHKQGINCIHEWNRIAQNKRPHYFCTVTRNNVFQWWQSNAQNTFNLEMFHQKNWYLTQLAEFFKEMIRFNGFEGN